MDSNLKRTEGRKRFLQAIADTNEVMQIQRPKLAINVTKSTPEQLGILKGLIFSETLEILTIFRAVFKSMEALRHSEERMGELRGELPSGLVNGNTPEGSQFCSVANQHWEILDEIRIWIKTLYEWLYHLRELIRKNPRIRGLVSDPQWSKLESHCEFRSKLVTHRQDAQVHISTGITYSPRDFKVELLLTPFVPPSSALKELDSLFTQCANVLNPEEAGENNYFERCRILYDNLDKFCDQRRGQIVSFFERYGAISAEPVALAEFVRDLVKDFVPRLTGL